VNPRYRVEYLLGSIRVNSEKPLNQTASLV
jgi:hypothetical protein